MGRVEGKVALVTGGARGMGEAHVRLLVAEGARVVSTDILIPEGEAVAHELGGSARFMPHDVSVAADWGRVVADTEAVFGPIDILVNNAGVSMLGSIEDLTEERFRKVIDINQVSVFLGMKAVLPSMRRAGGGSMINISSVAGMIGVPGAVGYSASKWAVRGMTKTAALEFGQYNIRVNSVHPGTIKTPMTSGVADKLLTRFALPRLGEVQEVASMVLFLASDESRYSTGAEFIVDGGWSIG